MKLIITVKEQEHHCGVNHPERCAWHCNYRDFNPEHHPCTLYPPSTNNDKATEKGEQ